MTYKLVFDSVALKEWRKLAPNTQAQFKKKLAERLIEPKVPADQLSGMPGCYKIKLARLGYRLVYRVQDQQIQIVVLAVGKRERSKVYKAASKRLARGERIDETE